MRSTPFKRNSLSTVPILQTKIYFGQWDQETRRVEFYTHSTPGMLSFGTKKVPQAPHEKAQNAEKMMLVTNLWHPHVRYCRNIYQVKLLI